MAAFHPKLALISLGLMTMVQPAARAVASLLQMEPEIAVPRTDRLRPGFALVRICIWWHRIRPPEECGPRWSLPSCQNAFLAQASDARLSTCHGTWAAIRAAPLTTRGRSLIPDREWCRLGDSNT